MITENKRHALDLFAQGRKFYKLMEFEAALDLFHKALEADPADSPSKVYAERCQYYLDNPPPEEWDGVFTMVTK